MPGPQKSKQPTAVLLSDVHYSLPTLELADKATRMAVAKSNELKVPLIVCGDLHDTKANLRGECVQTLMDTLTECDEPCYVLVGNHDLINEKAKDHSLHFLRNVCEVVDKPKFTEVGWLLPYYSDTTALKTELKAIKDTRLTKPIIMHQGLQTSNAGHYIQDKSALRKEDVAGCRVISGHYHTRQTIELPDGGQWDFVGNPYSLNFAEANDPPKGFQILYSDGSLEFVPTNLRKHVVEMFSNIRDFDLWLKDTDNHPAKDDLLWLKVSDHSEALNLLSRNKISDLLGNRSFKLEFLPLETRTTKTLQAKQDTPAILMDKLIDSLTETSLERKTRLKSMWKGFI